MKTKPILVAGLAVAVVAAIASMMFVNRKPEPVPAPVRVALRPAASAAPVVSGPALPVTAPVAEVKPQIQPSNPVVPAKTASKKFADQTVQPLVINGYEVQDPKARLALNFVGTDPDADAYWANAINNPNLPSEERKDLIEDLNEDGLSDPQHPGPQDLPMILARLQLIEQLAPQAMDQVNADAFAEAEKDLMAMANGQPPP